MRNISYLLILLTFSLSSCCTVARGRTQEVAITSEPAGAHINIDGYDCGTTPQSFLLTRKNRHRITLQKPGYQPEQFDLRPSLSGKVASNALLPIAGALAGAATGFFLGPVPDALVIGITSCMGLAAGMLAGGVGTGVDLYSGSAYNLHDNLSNQEIHTELQPVY